MINLPFGTYSSLSLSLSLSLRQLPQNIAEKPSHKSWKLQPIFTKTGKKEMSFQDFQKPSSSVGGRSQPQSPSQAVAAAIFQINTAVSAFRRLVDAIGTAKDTPLHRQKLSVLLSLSLSLSLSPLFFSLSFPLISLSLSLNFFFFKIFRHTTRQRILQLVKDTSAKIKTLSDSDHDISVNVRPSLSLSIRSFNFICNTKDYGSHCNSP